MSRSSEDGARWERRAEEFLRRRGLEPVARNFSCRLGEIDLILLDGNCLVFAEVRYRRSGTFGGGVESITRAKQQRLVRTARLYRQRHRSRARLPCRFDVISMRHRDGALAFDWIRNAFTA